MWPLGDPLRDDLRAERVAYHELVERLGGRCPIESGVLGGLVDHECRHGNLPTDRTITCDCWEEPTMETTINGHAPAATNGDEQPPEPPSANGHKPTARVTAAAVAATCARLREGFRLTDVATELGARPEAMRRHVRALVAAGQVEELGEDAAGKRYRWAGEAKETSSKTTMSKTTVSRKTSSKRTVSAEPDPLEVALDELNTRAAVLDRAREAISAVLAAG
jgi:hypothetical protein